MVIQFSREARNAYVKVCGKLLGKQKDIFAEEVANLYDKKVVSQEGEFDEFIITKDDLVTVLVSKCNVLRPELLMK